jgi:hypothetical protein
MKPVLTELDHSVFVFRGVLRRLHEIGTQARQLSTVVFSVAKIGEAMVVGMRIQPAARVLDRAPIFFSQTHHLAGISHHAIAVRTIRTVYFFDLI